MSVSIDSRTAAVGALLLRLTSGVTFLYHAYLKLFEWGMPATSETFVAIGLSGFLAWLVMIGEAAGGILLILGVHVRIASLWLILILAGASWAHLNFPEALGSAEFPIFWLFVQIVILLQGPGWLALPFSVFRRRAV